MDTLCGVGLPELLILALLGFVLIGPERSRDVALKAGRLLSSVMKSEWWQEFNDITRAIRNLPTTLVRMAELEETQADIQRAMGDINQGTRFDSDSAAPAQANSNPWGIKTPAAAPPSPQQTSGTDDEETAANADDTDEGA